MKKNKIKPTKTKKLFYYYPHHVVVIGVKSGDKINFMPCVWNTALSYDPFLYGVSVGSKRYTNQMLSSAEEYTINFLDFKYVDLVRSMGRSSGSEIDKTKEFNISYSKGDEVNVPILDVAYLSLECKKQSETLYGSHTLFVGDVKLIHLQESLLEKTILDVNLISPILYLGVDHYVTVDNDSLRSLKDLPFHESYRDVRINIK